MKRFALLLLASSSFLVCHASNHIIIIPESTMSSTFQETFTDQEINIVDPFAKRPIEAKAKCPLLMDDPKLAPKRPPKYSYGVGKAKTWFHACKAAKKDANDKVPRGMKAKHCRCLK